MLNATGSNHFKKETLYRFLIIFFWYQKNINDLVFCDISGSTDPFGLKFHRDAGKNISFRFVKFFIFFEPPVFVQKAKCDFLYDILFTERETTYSKSSSISQHNVFSICLKFTTKISKSEPKVKNCHEHHCFNVLNLYCA